jgi:hypothetical protein
MLLSLLTYALSQRICEAWMLLFGGLVFPADRGTCKDQADISIDGSKRNDNDKDRKIPKTIVSDSVNDECDVSVANRTSQSCTEIFPKREGIPAVWAKGLYCALITLISVLYMYKTVSTYYIQIHIETDDNYFTKIPCSYPIYHSPLLEY